MVDLIGSHEKFLPMKINASTATVMQIPRPQSKLEGWALLDMIVHVQVSHLIPLTSSTMNNMIL